MLIKFTELNLLHFHLKSKAIVLLLLPKFLKLYFYINSLKINGCNVAKLNLNFFCYQSKSKAIVLRNADKIQGAKLHSFSFKVKGYSLATFAKFLKLYFYITSIEIKGYSLARF